jgi:hypothetical protein
LKDSEIRVQCGSHGESSGAFVCTHLVKGTQRGFNCAAHDDDPDAMCPDAWCDDCAEALETAGGWTKEVEDSAAIGCVCTTCYSVIREKNWIQDDEAYQELIDDSIGFFNEQVESFKTEFRINDHERYDFDQETGQLIFSSGGEPAVICDVAFVGSIAEGPGTWMWSWANESNEEIVKARAREVRRYGEEQGFERLVGAQWLGTEADGWRMAAISTYLLDGIGAYRAPSDERHLFMVVTAARWAT